MDIPNNSWRQAHKRPKLLIYSLILSLILHVAVVLILPLFNTEERLPEERPTIVRLVEKPTPPEKQQTEQKPDQYEIDQQPTEPLPVKPVESFRKAERDQKVPKEQAPEGSTTAINRQYLNRYRCPGQFNLPSKKWNPLHRSNLKFRQNRRRSPPRKYRNRSRRLR